MIDKVSLLADKVVTTGHFDLMTIGEEYYVSPHSNRDKLLGPFKNVQINGRYVIEVGEWRSHEYLPRIGRVFNATGQELDVDKGEWVEQAPRIRNRNGVILTSLYMTILKSEQDMMKMLDNKDIVSTKGQTNLVYAKYTKENIREQDCLVVTFTTGFMKEPSEYMYGVQLEDAKVSGVWSLEEHLWKIPTDEHEIHIARTSTGSSIAFAQNEIEDNIKIAGKYGKSMDTLSLLNPINEYTAGFVIKAKYNPGCSKYTISKFGKVLFEEADRLAILEGVPNTLFVIDYKSVTVLYNGAVQPKILDLIVEKTGVTIEYQGNKYVLHHILSGIEYGVQTE